MSKYAYNIKKLDYAGTTPPSLQQEEELRAGARGGDGASIRNLRYLAYQELLGKEDLVAKFAKRSKDRDLSKNSLFIKYYEKLTEEALENNADYQEYLQGKKALKDIDRTKFESQLDRTYKVELRAFEEGLFKQFGDKLQGLEKLEKNARALEDIRNLKNSQIIIHMKNGPYKSMYEEFGIILNNAMKEHSSYKDFIAGKHGLDKVNFEAILENAAKKGQEVIDRQIETEKQVRLGKEPVAAKSQQAGIEKGQQSPPSREAEKPMPPTARQAQVHDNLQRPVTPKAEDGIQQKNSAIGDIVNRLKLWKGHGGGIGELVNIVTTELARTQGEEVNKYREHIQALIIQATEKDPSYSAGLIGESQGAVLEELATNLLQEVSNGMLNKLVLTNIANKLEEQLNSTYPDLKKNNPARYDELAKITKGVIKADISYQNFIKGNIPFEKVNIDKIVNNASTEWQKVMPHKKEAEALKPVLEKQKSTHKEVTTAKPAAPTRKAPAAPKLEKQESVHKEVATSKQSSITSEPKPTTHAKKSTSTHRQTPKKVSVPNIPTLLQEHAQSLRPESQVQAKEAQEIQETAALSSAVSQLESLTKDKDIAAAIGKKNMKYFQEQVKEMRENASSKEDLEFRKYKMDSQLKALNNWCNEKSNNSTGWSKVKDGISNAVSKVAKALGVSYKSRQETRAEAYSKLNTINANRKGSSLSRY